MREMIKRLIALRAQAWEGMKVLTDRAEDEARNLTGEEWAEWEARNADVGELTERINELNTALERESLFDGQRDDAELERLTRGDGERERRTDATPPASPSERLREQLQELRTGRLEELSIPLDGVSTVYDATRQRAVVETRDLTVGTGSEGGDTVPTEFVNTLWEHFIEHSAIRRTNVTVVTTAAGEALEVPKTTSHSSVSAVTAEGGAIAESDPAFAKVTLNAYKYGVVVQITRELLQDTGVNIVEYLGRQMGQALADGSGAHFITGDGSGKPNGVVTAATVGVTGGTGQSGEPTADELIDLQYSVIEAYARNAFWVVRRATEGLFRKLKDGNNQYIWAPGLQVGTPNQLLDRPIVTDPNVAATGLNARSVLFGDLSKYMIRDVGSVTLARSDDFAFTSDLVTFKATIRTDGDLIDTTGACKVYVGGAS